MEGERNHVQIEQLTNSFSLMGRQIEELSSEHDDLQKVRAGLESQIEPIISRFYQLSDVNAKLRESQVKARKKLDEAILKDDEVQKVNGVLADKAKDYILNCKHEQTDLVLWVSEWGERISNLSREFLRNAKLYYSDNLIEELGCKAVETEILFQQVSQAQFAADQLLKTKQCLETYINNCDSLDYFLNSVEAGLALTTLENMIEEQTNAKAREKHLQLQKQEIEKLLLES